MKKSEILAALAKHLDAGKLLTDYPDLDRDGLSKLLKEAASALGPVEVEPKAPAKKAPEKKPAVRHEKTHPSRKLILHTDGASRGNPGLAGIGVLIEDETGHIVKKIAHFLGRATNNQAEYAALLAGLKAAHELGADEVHVSADSELLVKQFKGEYRVKNPDLQAMHAEARALSGNFRHVVVKHIPREQNSEADALANQAIDRRLGPA